MRHRVLNLKMYEVGESPPPSHRKPGFYVKTICTDKTANTQGYKPPQINSYVIFNSSRGVTFVEGASDEECRDCYEVD